MAGIYIHYPFCVKKCIYCDFYSIGKNETFQSLYTSLLINELNQRYKEISENVTTVYFGGGTPSLIPIDDFTTIFNALKNRLGNLYNPLEITLEVNPDDITLKKALEWKALGFNRISLGIQSFNDDELKTLWRRHDSEKAIESFNILKNAGFENISLDLIFGIPGQTLSSLNYSLDHLFQLHPKHISIYCLMYEEGTPLTILRNKELVDETKDSIISEMYQLIVKRCKKENYNHYEISNFSLNGFESRHNSSYWNGIEYLGLGPGAHSYDGNTIRRFNHSDIKSYLKNFSKKEPDIFYGSETLSDEEILDEYILTRMRLKDGININEFQKRFGFLKTNKLTFNAKPFLKNNLIEISGNSLRLTEEGFLVSDGIITKLSML